MSTRLASPVVCVATTLVLLGACSDDGPTTLATDEGVELVGDEDLAGQTLDLSAEEKDGEVTGELRFSDVSGEILVTVECVVFCGLPPRSVDSTIRGLEQPP